MKNLIPSGLVLASVLSLSACSMQNDAQPVTPTATPVASLEQQLESPAPRAEPAFRTSLALNADATTIKTGARTTVKVSLAGLKQSATTFSTTLRVSENLKIVSITTNEAVLPMVFKSGVATDGKSASIAASNSKGFSGTEVSLAEMTVESMDAGVGTITVDANDTSVLLSDNSDVAPLSSNLPSVTITVQ